MMAWLMVLNFAILQWLGVRLGRVVQVHAVSVGWTAHVEPTEDGGHRLVNRSPSIVAPVIGRDDVRWTILRWVVPLTGWWTRYRWMSLRWEPRDIWVGLYWDRKEDGLHLFVCVVPCVVLHVRPTRRR